MCKHANKTILSFLYVLGVPIVLTAQVVEIHCQQEPQQLQYSQTSQVMMAKRHTPRKFITLLVDSADGLPEM